MRLTPLLALSFASRHVYFPELYVLHGRPAFCALPRAATVCHGGAGLGWPGLAPWLAPKSHLLTFKRLENHQPGICPMRQACRGVLQGGAAAGSSWRGLAGTSPARAAPCHTLPVALWNVSKLAEPRSGHSWGRAMPCRSSSSAIPRSQHQIERSLPRIALCCRPMQLPSGGPSLDLQQLANVLHLAASLRKAHAAATAPPAPQPPPPLPTASSLPAGNAPPATSGTSSYRLRHPGDATVELEAPIAANASGVAGLKVGAASRTARALGGCRAAGHGGECATAPPQPLRMLLQRASGIADPVAPCSMCQIFQVLPARLCMHTRRLCWHACPAPPRTRRLLPSGCPAQPPPHTPLPSLPPCPCAAARLLQRHPWRRLPGSTSGGLPLPRLRAARGQRPRPPALLLHSLRAPLWQQGAGGGGRGGAGGCVCRACRHGRCRGCCRQALVRRSVTPHCLLTAPPSAPPLAPSRQAKKWRLSIRIDPGAVQEASIGEWCGTCGAPPACTAAAG